MRLSRLAALGGLVLLSAFVAEVAEAASFPAAPLELVYVPITPCRAFDTAKVNAKIPANTTRNFRVVGSSNLTTQGGPQAGCGVPAYAAAVAINLKATAGSAAGSFTAFPYSGTRPGAETMVYQANAPAMSQAIVDVTQGYVSLYSSQSAHASGDVVGYYAPQIEGLISTGGGSLNAIYAGSPSILSVANLSTGVASVTVDRDVTYCAVIVSPYSSVNSYATAVAFNGDKVTVYSWRLDSTTHNAVLTNAYVYLAVHC